MGNQSGVEFHPRFYCEVHVHKLACEKLWICCARDHCCVVGGESARWKVNRDPLLPRFSLEGSAQFSIRGDTSTHQQRVNIIFAGCSQCFGNQIFHHRTLEGCNQIKNWSITETKVVFFFWQRDFRECT